MDVVFKVDEDYELASVLYKNARANRVAIVDTCCIEQFISVNVDADGVQPFLFSVIDFGDLVVLTTEFAKDFYHSAFYL